MNFPQIGWCGMEQKAVLRDLAAGAGGSKGSRELWQRLHLKKYVLNGKSNCNAAVIQSIFVRHAHVRRGGLEQEPAKNQVFAFISLMHKHIS